MATSTARHGHPARTLLIFVLVTLALFGLMAIFRTWTPKLGLDLRGGTTITLTARNITGTGGVDKNSLELARRIIQQRVDSLGVGESSVTTSGDNQIIVAVPNVQRDELVRLVGTTAQLQFRPVIGSRQVQNEQLPTGQKTATATPAGSTSPTATANPSATPVPSATLTPAVAASAAPAAAPTAPVSGQRRIAPNLPTAPPTPRPTAPNPDKRMTVEEAAAWTPSDQDLADFQTWKCDDPFPNVVDQPLFACDKNKAVKYLLGPVMVEGRKLDSAQAVVLQGQLNWQVHLKFNSEGAADFEKATKALSQKVSTGQNLLGIVLDNRVISAPSVTETITGGSAQITGSFTQKDAEELANVLKYGALPLTFDVSSVDNVSATLGSDQLRAGIIAGIIGLLLVVLYSFLYYRGLGIAVVASLVIAGTLTYALLTLLGLSLDLALNLPGIAGVIVAIGVTADSFIIYFERIRDEVREGRTLRSAIETGWRKARGTIVIADAVSLLSAAVLFWLAIGAVKGFAFTLGLTTMIDLAIIFFFTKPLLSLLGRTAFYGEGHRFSGLDPKHMGVERVIAPKRTGKNVRRTTVGKDL